MAWVLDDANSRFANTSHYFTADKSKARTFSPLT
jgi:hypothetical protein